MTRVDCEHGRLKRQCIECELEARIAELEGALRRINSINDHPGRFNVEIQKVLDSVIDTSDVKFECSAYQLKTSTA